MEGSLDADSGLDYEKALVQLTALNALLRAIAKTFETRFLLGR